MSRMRLSALILCSLVLIVFFNYIYVCSVRSEMLNEIDSLCERSDALPSPDGAKQTWKNRKGLLSLFVPLAVLDQIDIQLSVTKACAVTGDRDAYLRACYHLRELVESLGK